ncbi:MAG TPA: L17 family ribosomal protein, partial [bacterium]|nr:L17 family ribosomal protein [bacterium]
MRHRKKIRKLGRNKSNRRSLVTNLTIKLFEQQKLSTTLARARQVKTMAERLITLAKQPGPAAEQRIQKVLGQKRVVAAVKSAAEKYRERPGGY